MLSCARTEMATDDKGWLTIATNRMSRCKCAHQALHCLNAYELIRKYRCESCGAVMMCACEESFARRFLPHQIGRATEIESRRHVPVTHGFVPGTCNSCRGLPPQASPTKGHYGRTSKVYRFYWREIAFETIERFGHWMDTQGLTDWLIIRSKHKDMYDSIEKQVVAEIKAAHQQSPKYDYREESSADVIKKYQIPIVNLNGVYVKGGQKGAQLMLDGTVCSPEHFVARHYELEGYSVIIAESIPFHVIFGTYMWIVIQDMTDPQIQTVAFGERAAFESGARGPMVHTVLPNDFGTKAYAKRRTDSIEEHFLQLPTSKDELLWTFDYWTKPSKDLRNYLWAHRPDDVARARQIVAVLPIDVTIRILRFLVTAYWDRYCGWPDLLVYRNDTYHFVEVKSSKDSLSEQQKQWIREQYNDLNVPFTLVKIVRSGWAI